MFDADNQQETKVSLRQEETSRILNDHASSVHVSTWMKKWSNLIGDYKLTFFVRVCILKSSIKYGKINRGKVKIL